MLVSDSTLRDYPMVPAPIHSGRRLTRWPVGGPAWHRGKEAVGPSLVVLDLFRAQTSTVNPKP